MDSEAEAELRGAEQRQKAKLFGTDRQWMRERPHDQCANERREGDGRQHV